MHADLNGTGCNAHGPSRKGHANPPDERWEWVPHIIVTTAEYYRLVQRCESPVGRSGWDPYR
jgi:hypothetical protein